MRKEDLANWMREDKKRESILLSMANLWDKMDSLTRLTELFPKPVEQRARPSRYVFAMSAIAATIVMASVLVLFDVNPTSILRDDTSAVAVSSMSVFETAVGEQSSASLPDGTKVFLNTNTLLQVNITKEYRLLVLERGEVNIQVAPDKDRPLRVIAAGNVIEAVGTVFNLEISGDQMIELVVTEGKVSVGLYNDTGASDRDVSVGAPAVQISSVTVSAGEQLMLGIPDSEVKVIEPEEIEVRLSWKDGNLIFRGESLEEAVEEISRYTSVEFTFLDESLKTVRIAGLFKAGDVDGLLSTLKENFDISYQWVSEGKILLSSN